MIIRKKKFAKKKFGEEIFDLKPPSYIPYIKQKQKKLVYIRKVVLLLSYCMAYFIFKLENVTHIHLVL